MFFDFSIDQKVEWEIEKKYVETDLIPWLIETALSSSKQSKKSFEKNHFVISESVAGFRKHELKMEKPIIILIVNLE